MLTIDPRAGSSRLVKPLRRMGLSVSVERMTFGDVAFVGKGEDRSPVAVGIEYKTLGDALSCMNDARFTGVQLPGLRACYDDLWLIIEGLWRPGSDGTLLVRRGKRWGPLPGKGRRQIQYSRLVRWLLSIDIRGGARVVRTTSLFETCITIASLYAWWSFAALEEHKSHAVVSVKRCFTDNVGIMQPPEDVRMIAGVDGVGLKRARAALETFGSVRRAVNANAKDWTHVPGFGKTLASHMLKVVTNGEGEE